jgi:hypothetical protein
MKETNMALMTWTPEQKEQIAEYLFGTRELVHTACDQLGIPEVEDMENLLLDENIECCRECGYWVESYELVMDDDDQMPVCLDCQ